MNALAFSIVYDTWAAPEAINEMRPDVVFVATGGIAHTEILEQGNDLLVSGWDVIAGDVKPGKDVLIFDDVGDHVALQAAEVIAKTGARVELMSPDRLIAPDVMGMNLTPYMREIVDLDVTFSVAKRLLSVSRKDDLLEATLSSDYKEDMVLHRTYDQIVVNHGTVPLDDLYFSLRPTSSNGGEVDYDALIAGRPQTVLNNPDGDFQLFRIGDAVSGRNIHAAVYDSLRFGKCI